MRRFMVAVAALAAAGALTYGTSGAVAADGHATTNGGMITCCVQ